VKQLIRHTRYVALIAVVSSLALATMLFMFGALRAGVITVAALAAPGDGKGAKLFAIASVEIADLFLVGTVLYIVGVGLFELFIADVDLPAWLRITSVEQLKDRLVSVIVVALAVSFLGQAANWDGVSNLLPFGVSIAAVIVALAVFGLLKGAKSS
jgi:uncharacterized membrane protein YqhA